ncbi:MAG: hypothetical protein DIU69_00965 [Bacillota bacterium]|nr:MAG: hypothetical protein DIU69_00965 [Bacillota bacterium]
MQPGAGSFMEWTKQQRARDLLQRLPEPARRGWTFPRLVRLLQDLGLTRPRQYLEAGWWIPEEVRRDRARSDALYEKIQRAMADGRLPPRDAEYTWDDVERLVSLCGFTPEQLFAQLAYVYALTLGEEIFLETARRVAGADEGDPPGEA